MTLPALGALIAVAVTLALGVVLLITKAVNSWRGRFEGIRRAAYIAVFGELTTRGSYPLDILSSWSDDRVFRTALVDFIRLLDGVERDRLLRVARDLGIVDSAIIALRTSRRAKARVRAASMLAELADPKTVRPLTAALRDPEAGVRINAAAALAKIGEPAAIEAILERIDDETEWDAARVMDHLAMLGAPAVDGLLSYIGDLSERVPRYAHLAIQTLGEIGDLRAEPTLLAALQSPVTELRLAAAGALQTAGSLECVGPLIAAMADDDARVRARAAKSLGAHFDTRAIEPLYKGLRDAEWWVRKNSAAALARLPEGIPALQRALRDDDAFARDAAREQLMILGVPAGNTDVVDPEEVERVHDWIEDQLRVLERATADANPVEAPPPGDPAPAKEAPPLAPPEAPAASTGTSDHKAAAGDDASPPTTQTSDQELTPVWPGEPATSSGRIGGVPRRDARSGAEPERNIDAAASGTPVTVEDETGPDAGTGSAPALSASAPTDVPAAACQAAEDEPAGHPDGAVACQAAPADRPAIPSAQESDRAESLSVLDVSLASHGLGPDSEHDTGSASSRRAS